MEKLILHLIRLNVHEGRNYTKGVLINKNNNEKFCYTLEDKVRDTDKSGKFEGKEHKVYSETAIPYGEYEGFLRFSPSRNRTVPELKDVPYFEHIQLHALNTVEDSLGCIGVGYEAYEDKIWNSYEAERDLVELIRKYEGKFKIKIT